MKGSFAKTIFIYRVFFFNVHSREYVSNWWCFIHFKTGFYLSLQMSSSYKKRNKCVFSHV